MNGDNEIHINGNIKHEPVEAFKLYISIKLMVGKLQSFKK